MKLPRSKIFVISRLYLAVSFNLIKVRRHSKKLAMLNP